MHRHKWSKWQIAEATFTPGPLTARLDPNGPRRWTEQVQVRTCETCGKVRTAPISR